MLVERTHYYAKPGRAAEVLRTRRRASEVRRRLGLPAGRIFTRSATAAEGPDVVWECAFADPAAHARDLDARARSEEFGAVRAHMTALIDRFERAEKLTNEAWAYNETAGLKQLYRRTQLLQVSPYELLESAFPAVCSSKGGVLR